MKKYIAPFALGLCFWVAACNDGGNTSELAVITLSDKHSVTASQIVDTYRYVPLGDTERPIGSISRLIVTDEHIIAVDRDMARAVFVFDRDGVPRAEIYALGQGPGEYAELTHVAPVEIGGRQALAILDASSRKVLVYSVSGDFIESHRLPFRIEGMEYLSEDDVLCFAGDYAVHTPFFDGRDDAGSLIYFADGDFGIKDAAMPDPTPNRETAYTVPHVRRHDGHVTVIPPMGDTIYGVEGHALRPEYRIDMSALAENRPATETMTDNEIMEMFDRFPSQLPDDLIDGDDFIVLAVSMPQNKDVARFFYDKRSGAVRMLENSGGSGPDDARLANMALVGIKAVCGREYAADIPAYVIPMIYPDGSGNPSLDAVGEESNPVLVFYTLKGQ